MKNLKPTKILAKMSFGRQEIEDFLREELKTGGFVAEGEFTWSEDGGVEAAVRPMTPEEREEADLPEQDSVEERLDELEDFLETKFEGVFASANEIYSQIQQIKARPPAPKASEPEKSTEKSDDSAIELVSSDDYGLEDGEDPDDLEEMVDEEGRPLTEEQIKARRRVNRVRKEQEDYPDPYEHRRNEDGFVQLKSHK